MNSIYHIGGMQQVGIGVMNVDTRWEVYRNAFGFNVPIFRDAGQAPLMTRYTNGKIESRDALLAINMYGGGGMEIWQYTSRVPLRRVTALLPGDLGVYAVKLKCRNIDAAHHALSQMSAIDCSEIILQTHGDRHFFCKDGDKNLFEIIEQHDAVIKKHNPIGGVAGAIIGCRAIDASLAVYQDILRYTAVVRDTIETVDVNSFLIAGSASPSMQTRRIRKVVLQSEQQPQSPFAKLYGKSTIELWQLLPQGGTESSHAFFQRQWGDIGFIHLCFETVGIDALKIHAAEHGCPLTIDSGESFGMGEASGRFAYLEDADGTLIEFVETHRLQPIKKIPIAINVRRRRKPIAKLFLKLLTLGKVKK